MFLLRKRPLITIVICAYNASRCIERSLKSALSQTYDDIEVIVVDDCSDDGTAQIAETFAKKDKRLRIIYHAKNLGIALARKSGALSARGKYVAYLDADDAYVPQFCEVVAASLNQYSPDILHFPSAVINANNHSIETIQDVKDFIAPHIGNIASDNLIDICFCDRSFRWTLWNKVYDRKLLQRAFKHLPDEHICIAEDVLIMYLVLYYAREYIGIAGEDLYSYSFGLGVTGSAVSLQKFEQYNRQVLVVEAIKTFLEEVGDFDKRKTSFDIIYHDLIRSTGDALLAVDSKDADQACKVFVQWWGKENVDQALGDTASSFHLPLIK